MKFDLLLDEPAADPIAYARRLDLAVVSPGLTDVIADLAALKAAVGDEEPPPPGGLDVVLGERRAAALAGGLSVLPPDRLAAITSHPELLGDLQELVTTEGGPYWRGLLEKNGRLTAAADRVAAAVEARLDEAVSDRRPEIAPPTPLREAPPRRAGRAASALSAVAGAALTLLCVWAVRPPFLQRSDPAPGPAPRRPIAEAAPAWWVRPDELPKADSERAYLDALAFAAAALLEEPIGSAGGEAAQLLGTFRTGCGVLILAEHGPLDAASTDALRTRCRRWAAAFDSQRTDLEAGADPQSVRRRTETTVRALIATLRGDDILSA